ncbi:MAG TPA: hypothetical protein VFR90_07205 [Methylibium sp.]|uniref:patatin-like phospholipase family protein n=1 Tax=Methylibium sp. TaxID=2067992 RepID=UPI002DB6581B|nr:hypothetical protein [Methylibium sp.]HEU4458895.1 hypothetical protein [Methylibium sp.]
MPKAAVAESAPEPPSAPAVEGFASLAAAEAALIAERRRRAGIEADEPVVGLALSGGGVRSATYSLGLLRGLAQRGHLPRFDYLSSVSGGGYTAAMLGRLAIAAGGIGAAQAELANPRSAALGWLRRNGRYLTPAGARDVGIAIVTYLRAFLAIHGEFIAVAVPFALLVIAPHLWQVSTRAPFSAAAWQPWFTLWWPLAALLVAGAAPGLMAGYWVARDTGDPGARHVLPPWRDVVFVVLLLVALGAIWVGTRPPMPSLGARLTSPALVLVALTSSAIGLAASQLWLAATGLTRSLAVARVRHLCTFALRAVGLAGLAAFAFGALDLVSWWLLAEMQAGERWIWGGVGVGGVVIVVLRTLAQPLLALSQRAQQNAGRRRAWGPWALNLAGIVGLVALLAAWLMATQWFVFAPAPIDAVKDFPPLLRALLLAALCALWTLLTAGNAPMANASSLHSFYRARLTRAYLAIGNPKRALVPQSSEPAPDAADAKKAASVTAVVNGDDVGLANYAPESVGAPIHLINACLNQTRDDASGLYNADRKGLLVTASRRGFEVGPRRWVPMSAGADAGTLGRWTAVSGAAAAPGAGSYTSRGWALLLYFLGVRLGYWMAAPDAADGVLRAPLSGWRRAIWGLAVKPAMLWSEGTATFFGTARPWWYLSDGGHFDNTGIWPLLKRRVDFVVAADASADALYEFGDLENLVRKARIDFGCEIAFYTADEACALLGVRTDGITVLSPEDMANNHSARGVLLARVRYAADGDLPAKDGTLLIVKPNLHDALDVDLLAYAQRHPAFPHESTGDQSFDEAQWDGYQRLGEDVGRRFDGLWLAQLPGWRRVRGAQAAGLSRGASGLLPHPLKVGARLKAVAMPSSDERRAGDGVPLWRRAPKTAAIGATVGLTVSGTLGLSLWQALDQMQKTGDNERKEVQALVQRVEAAFKDYDPACPRVDPTAVTPFLVLNAVKDRQRLSAIEDDSIRRITGRVLQACPLVQAAAMQRGGASAPPAAVPAMPLAAQAVQQSNSFKGAPRCVPANEAQAASHLQLCNVLDVRGGSTDALSYWFPVVAPGKSFAGWIEAWLDAARETPEPRRCGAHEPLRDAVRRACASAEAAGPSPDPGAAALDCASSPGAPEARQGAFEPPRAEAAPDPGCRRAAGLLTLRTLVLDDASRRDANRMLDDLQAPGEIFIAAPVQDVVQFAALRQTRAPVPWPQPTLIVHRSGDADDARCAQVLSAYLACRIPQADGRPSKPWVRELPPSGRERPRVIELWLPAQ